VQSSENISSSAWRVRPEDRPCHQEIPLAMHRCSASTSIAFTSSRMPSWTKSAQHLMRYGNQEWLRSESRPCSSILITSTTLGSTSFCNIDGVSQANMYANLLRLPILSRLRRLVWNRNVQDELDHLMIGLRHPERQKRHYLSRYQFVPGQIDRHFGTALASNWRVPGGMSTQTSAGGQSQRRCPQSCARGSKLIEIPLHLVIPLLDPPADIEAQCGLTSIVIFCSDACRKSLVVRGRPEARNSSS